MLKISTSTRSATWRDRYLRSMRAADALMVAVTVAVAQLVRFGLESGNLRVDDHSVPYWLVGVLLGLSWWSWLELRGTRDERLIGYGTEETKQVLTASLVLFGAVAIVSYAFDIPTARGYVVVALPLGMALLVLGRHLLRRALFRRRRDGHAVSRTLVVGRHPGVVETLKSLQDHPGSGIEPVAMYVPRSKKALPAALANVPQPPNLLRPEDSPSVGGIVNACREYQVEALVLCASAPLSATEIRHLSWHLTDERIRLVLDTGLTDVAGPRIHTQLVAGLPLLHVSTPRMSWSRLMLKRTVDVLCAIAALAVLLPVMLLLAGIIKAHDGGPALFCQERVGQGGQTFRMWKFRSMYPDSEERRNALLAANECAGGVLFKMRNDPRVTVPGRWMRRYSLDELPQLLNVLLGQMSLVGPRPPLASEVEKYETHVNRRLRVKPGITGLWQVSGRSNLDWDQAVRLDLYYVENWSLVQDFVIVLRTVKAVISRDGAY